MDDFTPIKVDPDAEDESRLGAEAPPAVPTKPKLDAADVGIAAAHNLYILGVIERQMDATASGAAEVSGVADQPVAAAAADPLDPDYAHDRPTDAGGDGCLASSFALLITLTLAAGSALALVR